MVGIRFHDPDSERKAIGLLIGKVSFKSFADGLTILPPSALPLLATAGLKFVVEGQASYDRAIPTVRDPLATPV